MTRDVLLMFIWWKPRRFNLLQCLGQLVPCHKELSHILPDFQTFHQSFTWVKILSSVLHTNTTYFLGGLKYAEFFKNDTPT